jgi:branched-chain amino acid transport system substrate-binding protein
MLFLMRTYRFLEGIPMRMKALGALVCALVVLAGSLPLEAQAPIRIGASLSITGTYAKLGKNQHEGYKLCEKDVNAKGGLLGRKIEFVVYDDQSMPATAVRLYEKLITEDKVDGLMGPYSSPVTEAVANVTEKYKKVLVSPLAATTSIFKKTPRRQYIFMVISPAEIYLEGLLDIAAKRGLKTVAVVNEDTLFSKAAAAGAVDLAKKKGLQVLFTEAYPKGNTDFSALLTKVKAANPDVLAAATYFDDAVALTRQMRELNVNPKAYGVTVGGDLPEFYDTLKQNAEYIYGATQWEHTLPYPGNQEFFETYKKEFNHEPSYHSAAGYAGCLVYAEAVKRAGSLEADKVREQLHKLEMRTIFGDFKVDQDGFQIAHKMVTFQWQGEKKITVWPDDLAQGKPRFPTPPWNQR